VKFNNTHCSATSAATAPTALRVIPDAGVTSRFFTSALVIKNKLLLMELQVNHGL
jgi:hypothetical protein